VNKKRIIIKFSAIAVTLIIGLSASVSSTYLNQYSKDISELSESHLIENETYIIDNPRVPYIGQETDFYCGFASFTMLINYFVDNVTLKEVLYNSGVGYTTAHFRPQKFHICLSTGLCIGKGHFKTGTFLASLYGLEYEEWNAKRTESNWDEYWYELKDKIKQKIPVATCINPFIMNPDYYRDVINVPDDETPIAGHTIVIVGFDESLGLIYYNEPGPDAFGGNAEDWTYANISIESFKESFQRAGPNYNIWYFKNTSGLPLSKKDAFNKSYENNIKRLGGEYYEKVWRNIPYTSYGIDAVKAMKKDLKIGLRNRFATILSLKFFKIINFTIDGNFITSFQMKRIATEKQYISEYLLENNYLSSICKRDGELFAQDSNLWYNLSLLSQKFFIAACYGPIKSRILLKPIIKEIDTVLDQIISVEEAIIQGCGL